MMKADDQVKARNHDLPRDARIGSTAALLASPCGLARKACYRLGSNRFETCLTTDVACNVPDQNPRVERIRTPALRADPFRQLPDPSYKQED